MPINSPYNAKHKKSGNRVWERTYSIFQVNEVRASGHGSANAPTINDYLYLSNLQFAVSMPNAPCPLALSEVERMPNNYLIP
ncbi:hypothetical protein H6G15_08225 [Calothrix sp. FACHB-168]|nr:hypothetical protein [Calothrix sp. FACHB-168]